MINAIIIDDETNAIIGLQNLLQKYCKEIEVVATASSATEGRSAIESFNPDLIFLDISMPGGDGFSLLEHFQNPNFEIVFVTAYNEYAIKAFEFSAMHYILKPINYRHLQEVENRFIKNKEKTLHKKDIKILYDNFHQENKKLVLSGMDKSEIVAIDDIVYIESVNNYLVFYCSNSKSIIITKQLNYYEKLLEEDSFFRIHHRYLVNLKHITKYLKGRGGQVSLSNGKELDVSTRKKHDFLIVFKQFFKEK